MAKVSRSSKKQPDFDPSELEDLIFSPAVGKGVGSHLIPPDLATVVRTAGTNMSTVVTSDSDLDMHGLTTVARSNENTSAPRVPAQSRRSSVDLATVVTNSTAPVPPVLSTVVTSEANHTSETAPVAVPLQDTNLWITEGGDLVPQGRVKKIKLAQDVINSAEECVYDTLWNADILQVDEKDSSRLVQAGYDYLVKRTRLSRKTIQRIIAKLLDKDFIAIETRADIYQRSSTVYRVHNYRTVLDKHIKRGRLHVAKIGPGFAYAQPLNRATDMTIVGRCDVTTVVKEDMATVVRPSTVTMVKMDRPTVVKMSPYLLDTDVLGNTSSAALFGPVQKALSQYGTVDDDAVSQLVRSCLSVCPDCTADEIVAAVHEKGRLALTRDSRIQNPIGFLLSAVPKCLSGDLFEAQRARSAQAASSGGRTKDEQHNAAQERWRREQEAALLDPSVPEQEKNLIRLCLGLNPQ